MRSTRWDQLPVAMRNRVNTQLGSVVIARRAEGGNNSDLAEHVQIETGERYFLKGCRTAGPRARLLEREEAAAAAMGPVPSAARCVARIRESGWEILIFEFVPGRPCDVRSGSPDLVLLAETLGHSRSMREATTVVPTAEQRWSAYVNDAHLVEAITGSTVCHTDFNPDNIIISEGRAVLVDWAWATIGATWLDTAIAPVWLIATGGQSAEEAERWAHRSPHWRSLDRSIPAAFTRAYAAMWSDIAKRSQAGWSYALEAASLEWTAHLAHAQPAR